MHSIFALLGLIVLAFSQFHYFATQFRIMVLVALTVRGKFCIKLDNKEKCFDPENCDIFLCQFTSHLTFIGLFIFGIVLILIIFNITIYCILKKVGEKTLSILNVIDAFFALLPALISMIIFITYLIFPLIYTDWNFSIQLAFLLMVCTCCFCISLYFLLTRTIKKRRIQQRHGKMLIMPNEFYV